MNLPTRRPRYADVVGTLALVVALGGTAYAAQELPRNSVGTPQLQKDAVTAAKIEARAVRAAELAPDSVGSGKIKDSAVRSAALAAGAVTASRLADGVVGTSKLADVSVTGAKLANGSVGSVAIADGAVSGADIANASVGSVDVLNESLTGADLDNGSVTLADLSGVNITTTLDITASAGVCGQLAVAATGAQLGQAVLVTFIGAVVAPDGLTFSPFRVSNPGQLTFNVCNVTASPISVNDLGVRIVTFD